MVQLHVDTLIYLLTNFDKLNYNWFVYFRIILVFVVIMALIVLFLIFVRKMTVRMGLIYSVIALTYPITIVAYAIVMDKLNKVVVLDFVRSFIYILGPPLNSLIYNTLKKFSDIPKK